MTDTLFPILVLLALLGASYGCGWYFQRRTVDRLRAERDKLLVRVVKLRGYLAVAYNAGARTRQARQAIERGLLEGGLER